MAMGLLMANAVSVFVWIYQMIDLFSYYAIPLSTVIERFGVRYGVAVAAAIAGLVSVVQIWRRLNVGRWLAIGSWLILYMNHLVFEIADRFSLSRSFGTAEDAIVFVLSLTLGLIPTLMLFALLTLGRRTNHYFRGPDHETPTNEPPSPPVFDTYS